MYQSHLHFIYYLPFVNLLVFMINPGFNVGTYVIISMGKLLILSLLVLLAFGDKILVILDNKQLETSHSQFFELLKGEGKHQVEIAHSFGKNNIELKYYDRFRYQHIVVMCTSDKGKDFYMKTPTVRSRPETSSLTSTKEAT